MQNYVTDMVSKVVSCIAVHISRTKMNYTLWPEILSLNALKVNKEIILFRHF